MAQSWRQWNKNFFTVCGHEVILKGFLLPSVADSSIYSSQREYFFIVFYNNKHSFIFIFTRL